MGCLLSDRSGRREGEVPTFPNWKEENNKGKENNQIINQPVGLSVWNPWEKLSMVRKTSFF